MSQRLVRPLLVLAVLVAGACPARAGVSVAPNPVAIGSTPVGTPASMPFTVSESAIATTDTLDIDLSAAGCAAFTVDITPITVTMATPASVTATFTPTLRGAVTCPAALRNHANGNLVLSFNMTGTGTGPALTIAPSPANFAATRVTTGAIATQLLTLKNTGESDLTLTSFAFAAGTDFSETTGPTLPLTLAPIATAAVTVQFRPTAPGARTDTFQVTSDAVGVPTTIVTLNGTGTNAQLAVADVPFGNVISGTTAAASISISNSGPAPVGTLAVTQAVLADTSGWFSFGAASGCAGQATCPLALSVAGLPMQLGVTCTPTPATATGSQTATVTFTSDSDPPGTSNVANLSCTGVRSDISLVPPTSSLAFGDIPVNTSSPTLSFNVHNGGSGPLTYTTAVSGAGYTLASAACTPCTIPAGGADKTVSVKFTPNAIGEVMGTLTLTDNDPDPGDGTITIGLDGTGIASQISVAPPALVFGNVDIGKSSALVLTAQNNGNVDLHVSAAALTGSAAFTVTDGALTGQTLAPGAATTWTIKCTPTVTMQKTGTFTINSDSLSNQAAAIALSCTGQSAQLTVMPASFDFMSVREGDSTTAQFTLVNSGNATVSGITATLSNTTLGYSIVTPPPASLTGNGTALMTVKFNPTSTASGGADTITLAGAWGSAPQTPTSATISLTGTDVPAGFSLSTATLAFGDVAWNKTASQTFTIALADPAALKITNLDVAPDPMTTQTGEIAVGTLLKNGNPTALPVTLSAMSDVLTVTVNAKPADRLGPLKATLTVTTDLNVNPTRTVMVTANSVSPAVSLTPPAGTLDFGQVDVDGSPVTLSIILTNSGDAPLTIGAVTTTNPQNVFTFALPPPSQTTVAPQASVSVQVTYTPVLEENDTGTVVIPVSGVFGIANGGQSTQTIQITGQGTNRHISIAQDAITFPPTFRYPTTPPQLPVHVSNTGLAPLHIHMVEITGSTVFTLADSSMVTIEGSGSHDFIVTFDPLAAGPVPEGILELDHDDTPKGQPDAVAHILLDGTGIDRQVAMGPTVVDLGTVGIGIPRRLTDLTPDGLQVISMDPANTFHIHAITVDDPAQFSLLHAPQDVDLAPSATDSFDVEFSPRDVGDFTATISLYLDDDPDPRANVMVHGTGVFVDARGSGGCQAGGGGGAGGALLVAGVLVGAARRRRRAKRASGPALRASGDS